VWQTDRQTDTFRQQRLHSRTVHCTLPHETDKLLPRCQTLFSWICGLWTVQTSPQLTIRYRLPCSSVFLYGHPQRLWTVNSIWFSSDAILTLSPWVNAVEAIKHTFYVKGSYFEHTIVTVYVWMGCSSSLYFFGKIYEKCWYLLHIFCQVVRQCSSGEVEDSMPDTCADTFWL